MKIKIYLIIILILFIFTDCNRHKKSNDDENYYSEGTFKKKGNASSQYKLPIDYKKLEPFIGNNFISVSGFSSNLDGDNEEEIFIAYKINESSNIEVIIFDKLAKDVLKKKFDFDTEIFDIDSFIAQSHNLFYENDINIIIEGKTIENKSKLYILNYNKDDYKLVGDFTADYSILIDYTEQDYEKGKFVKLKEVNTIDNSFSATNTNIQQKKVYTWDYDKLNFKLVETSQIYSSNTEVDRNVFSSEENFLHYLKGFWYPEKYKYLIENDKVNPDKYNFSNIEFISFSENPKQINIKSDDYMNKFSILKIDRLWGQKPGLRFKIQGIVKSSSDSYKFIEVYLMESNSIKVTGPSEFDDNTYIRLPKPFLEYIEDKNKKLISSEENKIYKFLVNDFQTDDGLLLKFYNKNSFVIQKNDYKENGSYQIKNDELGFIIDFIFENTNTLLKDTNFLIKISNDSKSFSIIPIKIGMKGFIVQDLKSIIFYQKR